MPAMSSLAALQRLEQDEAITLEIRSDAETSLVLLGHKLPEAP